MIESWWWGDSRLVCKNTFFTAIEECVMSLKSNVTYHVLQGRLEGNALKPLKVSKCGSFAFFKDPLSDNEVRVHSKHLSTEEPARSIALTESKENESMVELQATAHSYVTSENLKRIETLRVDLVRRQQANMAEVEAIKSATAPYNGEFDEGIDWTNWLTIERFLVALCFLAAVTLGLLHFLPIDLVSLFGF